MSGIIVGEHGQFPRSFKTVLNLPEGSRLVENADGTKMDFRQNKIRYHEMRVSRTLKIILESRMSGIVALLWLSLARSF